MAAIGAMMATGGAQMAMGAFSAMGQLAAGSAQKRQYAQQARQAEIQGRSQAIAYKQKGADALRNLNETLAAIISGSAATLQQYAMGEGVREFNIAADNAVMALGQASTQAGIYQSAGRAAQLSSFVSAAGNLGQGAYRYGQLQ